MGISSSEKPLTQKRQEKPPQFLPLPITLSESAAKPKNEKVRAKLNKDLRQVQFQKEKLEYDLEHHNCIKLSLLTRDFDTEIENLTQAIQKLQEGNPQEAINYLEEQACRNLVNVEELTRSQNSLFAEYARLEQSLKTRQETKASAISPEDQSRFSNDEVVVNTWAQYEAKRIEAELRQEHPDWFKGPNNTLLPERKKQPQQNGLESKDYTILKCPSTLPKKLQRRVLIR